MRREAVMEYDLFERFGFASTAAALMKSVIPK
jgi:hypothetical protein